VTELARRNLGGSKEGSSRLGTAAKGLKESIRWGGRVGKPGGQSANGGGDSVVVKAISMCPKVGGKVKLIHKNDVKS